MLAGKIVRLRGVRADDLPALYDIAAEADTWEERTAEAPKPLNRVAFDERFGKRRDDPHHVDFAVTVEDRLVGSCALTAENALARHAEVGISLAAGERGKGYGTDAMRVLIDYAFVRRNLRRLHLVVVASNKRAIASYRNVGFVEEGRLREHAWVRGRYEDEVRMGLLRSEWQDR